MEDAGFFFLASIINRLYFLTNKKGLFFFANNVLNDYQIQIIKTIMPPWHRIVVVPRTLLLFRIDFKGQRPHSHQSCRIIHIVARYKLHSCDHSINYWVEFGVEDREDVQSKFFFIELLSGEGNIIYQRFHAVEEFGYSQCVLLCGGQHHPLVDGIRTRL